MVLSKRGVVVKARVAWLLCISIFLAACCIFCLGLFLERYLGCSSVPGQGLHSCVVVWFSCLVAVLVGAFVALLVAVFVFAFM